MPLGVPFYLPRPTTFDLVEPVFVETATTQSDAVLESLKAQIGGHIARIGPEAWKAISHSVDAVATLQTAPDAPPASRAYFKLVELHETAVLPPPRTALLLCEAPGGFAQAALDLFPQLHTVHVSSQTRPGAPRFAPSVLRHPRVTQLDDDNGGDLLDPRVRDAIVRSCAGTADLVTADGALDNALTPELAEVSNAHLVACEIETALRCQRRGGTFVLKIFGFSCAVTHELIALLADAYADVALVKPSTSHAVNDERYIVARGYAGSSAAFRAPAVVPGFLARVADLDAAWRAEAAELGHLFRKRQADALADALVKCTSSRPRAATRGPDRGRRAQRAGRGAPPRRPRAPPPTPSSAPAGTTQ